MNDLDAHEIKDEIALVMAQLRHATKAQQLDLSKKLAWLRRKLAKTGAK